MPDAKDYAIEFGRYLADAAERFMEEQNRAAQAEETPNSEHWSALQSAIHEFRKRVWRVDTPTVVVETVPMARLIALRDQLLPLLPNNLPKQDFRLLILELVERRRAERS